MTRHYLAGELSLLLRELQFVTSNEVSGCDVALLRYVAETTAPGELWSVVVRALALTDCLCWESLERADAAAFSRLADVSVGLHEFGVSAGLIDDG